MLCNAVIHIVQCDSTISFYGGNFTATRYAFLRALSRNQMFKFASSCAFSCSSHAPETPQKTSASVRGDKSHDGSKKAS